MPIAVKTRWFALCLFALAYILTAAAYVKWNHSRGPGCGSAECILLLQMARSPASR